MYFETKIELRLEMAPSSFLLPGPGRGNGNTLKKRCVNHAVEWNFGGFH